MAALTPSYVNGASDQPLLGQTIGAFFDAACAKMGGAAGPGGAPQKVRLSYGELREQVDHLAAGLVTLGLEPGDRIGIWFANNSEWVLTQFATAKAGLILVNINPSYRVTELEYALNKVGCKALILADASRPRTISACCAIFAPELGQATPGELDAARLPALRSSSCSARAGIPAPSAFPTSWRAAAPRGASASKRWHRIFSSTIRSTSSSPPARPGFPRARHCRITTSSTTASSSARRCAHPQDRLCIPVPLYHCFGMCWAISLR